MLCDRSREAIVIADLFVELSQGYLCDDRIQKGLENYNTMSVRTHRAAGVA